MTSSDPDALGDGGSGVHIPDLRTTLLTSSVSELALVICSGLLQRVPMVFHMWRDPWAHYLWDIYFRLLFDNLAAGFLGSIHLLLERPWDLHHMFANQLTKIHL